MDTTEEIKRKNFLRIISSFEFHVYFHKKRCPKGTFLFRDDPGQDFRTEPNEDYWDFDIEIVEYRVQSLIENRNKVSYGNYLEKFLEEFKESHELNLLKKYSKADCFLLLREELKILKDLIKGYEDFNGWGDENEQTVYIHFTKHKETKIIPSEPEKYQVGDNFIILCISNFLEGHREIVNNTIEFLELKLEWLNLTNEKSFAIENIITGTSNLDKKLFWNRSDTDLLELITALMEIKAINNIDHNLTRKDAIETFSKIFDREIKDAESKLSRATERKKDVSPFLSTLKESFDNYAIRKEQK